MKPIFFHLHYAAFALAITLLTGCGGGGDNAGALPPPLAGQGLNNASSAKLCGVDVGTKLLEGVVIDLDDGDTINLSSGGSIYKIRLDSIDAPERAQPFGRESETALSAAVLGKPVKVAYTKTDKYGRIVGAVFTDSCQYVNLNQVSSGMAWFYKAYQCEVSAAVRQQFSEAQSSAAATDLGLWAQADPEAPWFYRNGSEPVTPVCKSDAAVPPAGNALTATGPTSPANSSTTTSAGTCYTGPRGGTYTLNANGTKNYSGC